jgi:hypothetical protein
MSDGKSCAATTTGPASKTGVALSADGPVGDEAPPAHAESTEVATMMTRNELLGRTVRQ